jgi:hypothetical protein
VDWLSTGGAIALITAGHENAAYDLTGTELPSFGDMGAIVAKMKGRPIRHAPLSETAQGEILAKRGLPKYQVDGLIKSYSLSGLAVCLCDGSRAEGDQSLAEAVRYRVRGLRFAPRCLNR